MKLRGRFTLWFVLAALLPIVVAAVGTRQILSQNYRDEFEQRAEQARVSVERNLRRLEETVADKVDTMSNRDDPFVGGLLQELDKEGAISSELLYQLRLRGAPNAMRLARFDLLMVIGTDDVVLVAPHHLAAQDELDRDKVRLARTLAGRAFYTFEQKVERTARGLETRTLLVAEAVRSAEQRGFELTVVGGVAVGDEVLEPARQPESIDARIVDAAGTEITPPAGRWNEVAEHTDRVPLRGPGGAAVAFIEIGISARKLEELLSRVTVLSAALGGAAFLLMILFGYLVARQMTGHLDDLVTGAQAAARGDLDHQVPVRTADEIGEVAEALNKMMVDLKDSNERAMIAERVAAWQEIARRLAHEIKNPLTPIQMAMETLRRTFKKDHPSFDEIFEESTSTVLEEASRLKRIASEFSEFARMPKPEKRACDLNDVVSSALALYQGSVSVEKDLAELPAIQADRDSMSQVVLNLLENARDAISQRADAAGEGRIVVQTRVTRDGKAVALVVEDNGPGLAPDVKDRLFTPYFTTKQGQGGTGLGLAIVHRIVSDHGGKISAGEATSGGARFVIELPTPSSGPNELATSLSGRWLR